MMNFHTFTAHICIEDGCGNVIPPDFPHALRCSDVTGCPCEMEAKRLLTAKRSRVQEYLADARRQALRDGIDVLLLEKRQDDLRALNARLRGRG